jgi:hypothetical protein
MKLVCAVRLFWRTLMRLDCGIEPGDFLLKDDASPLRNLVDPASKVRIISAESSCGARR